MSLDFIVGGAQKSSTTYLRNCLSEHPDVFMPEAELPNFEDPDYGNTSWDSLFSYFSNDQTAKVRGFKRPNYLAKPECPKNIFEKVPDVKLVFVLRNPVTRAMSAYYHQVAYGKLPAESAEIGMRKVLHGDYDEDYATAPEILSFGNYYEQLTRYFEVFSKDQILLMIHETFTANPGEHFKELFQFLGVDDTFVPTQINQKGIHSSPRSLIPIKASNLISEVMFEYSDRRYSVTPRQLSEKESQIVSALNNLLGQVLTPLYRNSENGISDTLKKELVSYYEEEVRNLKNYLGSSIDHWEKDFVTIKDCAV